MEVTVNMQTGQDARTRHPIYLVFPFSPPPNPPLHNRPHHGQPDRGKTLKLGTSKFNVVFEEFYRRYRQFQGASLNLNLSTGSTSDLDRSSEAQ